MKRWWWVGAIVVVGGLVAYMVFGRGNAAPTTGTGPTASGVNASGTVTPSGAATGTEAPGTGTPAGPKGSGGATVSKPKVVAKGSKLATVTVPPAETIAQIKFTASRAGSLYDARFRVYGFGPGRGGHGTVVALLDRWTPQKTTGDPLVLAGKNALLEVGPGVSVTKGGSYNGVVELMKRGDVVVFVLTKAKLR